MANILVVEDLEENYFVLRSLLEKSHKLVWADSVKKAMSLYNSDVDLILLDIGLPDGDGFQFCDWVRTEKKDQCTPMIFITARSSVESRILGYSIGGDDYIQRPFNSVELKARIDAKLRSSNHANSASVELGGIQIDFKTMEVHLGDDNSGEPLDLTPIEFKILGLLASEPNKVFSRDEMLSRVWGDDLYIYPRSVDTHVSKLRKKLGCKGEMIRSVHGVAYRIVHGPGSVAAGASDLIAQLEMKVSVD